MDVILLGPPGAGKGTQATVLVEQIGLVHVSTGDLFRAALRDGTELGQQAKSYMDKGELVPDQVVIGMVMERIDQPDCEQGVMFDGFPRTLEQASALDAALKQRNRHIDAVIYISVPEDVLLKRIAGRRTCKNCGAVYNVYYFPTRQEGICDACGSDQLYQRSDDTLETAQNRLDVYFRQTMPLIDYYRERDTLREMNGDREVEAVTHDMMEMFNRGSGHG